MKKITPNNLKPGIGSFPKKRPRNLSFDVEYIPGSLFEEDRTWLNEVENCIQNNLDNNHYTIQGLAVELSISERHLRRKTKELLGLRPSKYLLLRRLERARKLLEEKRYKTISQVAHAVGFRDPGAFRRNFETFYEEKLSEYF